MRSLTGLLPVGNGLLDEPCLGVVMGHQLGLGLYWSQETAPPTPGQSADDTVGVYS